MVFIRRRCRVKETGQTLRRLPVRILRSKYESASRIELSLIKWIKAAADDGFPGYPLFDNDANWQSQSVAANGAPLLPAKDHPNNLFRVEEYVPPH